MREGPDLKIRLAANMILKVDSARTEGGHQVTHTAREVRAAVSLGSASGDSRGGTERNMSDVSGANDAHELPETDEELAGSHFLDSESAVPWQAHRRPWDTRACKDGLWGETVADIL